MATPRRQAANRPYRPNGQYVVRTRGWAAYEVDEKNLAIIASRFGAGTTTAAIIRQLLAEEVDRILAATAADRAADTAADRAADTAAAAI